MISPSSHRIVFLAGPMSLRHPALATTRAHFAEAARRLRHQGFMVINIFENHVVAELSEPGRAVRACLRGVADADAVVALRGHRSSPEAMAAVAAARAVPMPVVDPDRLRHLDPTPSEVEV